MKHVIENCWMILPGHKVGSGDLEIEGERISNITLRNQATEKSNNRLVLPGLVNCHGHTAMTLVRGLGGGLPLQRWLEEAIFPVEAKMRPEDVYAGTAWGVREMLAGGTTSVADMYDFPGDCARAFAEGGMKARVCRVGLGFVPGRLNDCIEFTRSFNSALAPHPSSLVSADLCIHSEYLTDEAFCRGLAEANKEQIGRASCRERV